MNLIVREEPAILALIEQALQLIGSSSRIGGYAGHTHSYHSPSARVPDRLSGVAPKSLFGFACGGRTASDTHFLVILLDAGALLLR